MKCRTEAILCGCLDTYNSLRFSLQHKSLLLFGVKVIVAKVKLCSKIVSNHLFASMPVALTALYHAKMQIASILCHKYTKNDYESSIHTIRQVTVTQYLESRRISEGLLM